jgi:hypothetical protein
MENKFALLYDDDDVRLEKVTLMIQSDVETFVAAMKSIAQLYQECGIGDTETDEAITQFIYEKLHE